MSDTEQIALPMQSIYEDDSHYLKHRGVIELRGEKPAKAIQPIIVSSLDKVRMKPVFTYVVSETGEIIADLYIIKNKDVFFIDCAKISIPEVLELLKPHCKEHEIEAIDASDNWRVFALLSNQTMFGDGNIAIKYVDPRMQMGKRVMRPFSDHESSAWSHEKRWITHSLRMGMIPYPYLLKGIDINVMEANLHKIGVLDEEFVNDVVKKLMTTPNEEIHRRLLPLRVEPTSGSFPTMTGQTVTSNETETAVGKVVFHLGLFAIVLVELKEWREVLGNGETLLCAKQPVLITWPSFFGKDGKGKAGPFSLKQSAINI
jgi:hypothetical protein